MKWFWALIGALLILPWAAGAQTDQGTATCTPSGKRILTIADQADGEDHYIKLVHPQRVRALLLVFDVDTVADSATILAHLRTADLDGGDPPYDNTSLTNTGSIATAAEHFHIFMDGSIYNNGTSWSEHIAGVIPGESYLFLQIGGTVTDLDFTVDCWAIY